MKATIFDWNIILTWLWIHDAVTLFCNTNKRFLLLHRQSKDFKKRSTLIHPWAVGGILKISAFRHICSRRPKWWSETKVDDSKGRTAIPLSFFICAHSNGRSQNDGKFCLTIYSLAYSLVIEFWENSLSQFTLSQTHWIKNSGKILSWKKKFWNFLLEIVVKIAGKMGFPGKCLPCNM